MKCGRCLAACCKAHLQSMRKPLSHRGRARDSKERSVVREIFEWQRVVPKEVLFRLTVFLSSEEPVASVFSF